MSRSLILLLLQILAFMSRILIVRTLVTAKFGEFNGTFADTYNWTAHPCNRDCSNGYKPMTCEYVFVVEIYTTMSRACYDCPYNIDDCSRPHCIPADGYAKAVYVANRLLPGPTIEVCQGDTLEIEVRNALEGSTTAIHWHGIRQENNPYMDGIPYVTQCPILPNQKFKYTFNVTKDGTYLWHSHVGGQRGDGLFGKLIVRTSPENNPIAHLYDFDHHHMILIEWKKQLEDQFYIVNSHIGLQTLRSMLVNGMGRFKNFAGNNEEPLYTPVAVFKVKKGFKYRFRLINAVSNNCPMQIYIDKHTMIVISTDANDVEPLEVDTFISWPGERYDFIIHANQHVDNYWIRYRGRGGICRDKTIYQVAVLQYENAPKREPKLPLIGWEYPNETFQKLLNPYFKSEEPKSININELRALNSTDRTFKTKPDYQFYIGIDVHYKNNHDYHREHLYGINQVRTVNQHVTPQLNHLTFVFPNVPILSQRDSVDSDLFCNATEMADKNCSVDECSCTHLLQVKRNKIVELIMIDEGINGKTAAHPFHLHGHFFRVVAMEEFNTSITVDLIKKMDQEGKIERNLKTAPLKDTVRVPKCGYVIIRFFSDNPGYWFYHCHIEHHLKQGLALIFKVGEHEEMPPVPESFPKCESYLP